MVHLGKNTKSTIISKGISAMKGRNAYRGLVRVGKKSASNAKIFLNVTHFLIETNAMHILIHIMK